jgi:hypothetical protein
VVSSTKKTGRKEIDRFFIVTKEQALLTVEFKTAIFANCQILNLYHEF